MVIFMFDSATQNGDPAAVCLAQLYFAALPLIVLSEHLQQYQGANSIAMCHVYIITRAAFLSICFPYFYTLHKSSRSLNWIWMLMLCFQLHHLQSGQLPPFYIIIICS